MYSIKNIFNSHIRIKICLYWLFFVASYQWLAFDQFTLLLNLMLFKGFFHVPRPWKKYILLVLCVGRLSWDSLKRLLVVVEYLCLQILSRSQKSMSEWWCIYWDEVLHLIRWAKLFLGFRSLLKSFALWWIRFHSLLS